MLGWFGRCTPQMPSCTACTDATRTPPDSCTAASSQATILHSESKVPAPSKPHSGDLHGERSSGPRLTVAQVFPRFQFSVIYTQLGATQGTLMDEQRGMLQKILKHFTSELSGGPVVVAILAADGTPEEHSCQLDKDVTQLVMRPMQSPSISAADAGGGCGMKLLVFREIERICSPEEVRNLIIEPPLLQIGECCTTIVLAGNRCLTFKLDSVVAREYLMLCLQVLRMSQERARMWYP